MSKALRRTMVDDLARRLEGQKNVVLLDVSGLTASQAGELRGELREDEVRMRLVKNSVAIHGFRKLGVESFEKHLTGMSALVFGPDPLAIAKKVAAFRERHQRPSVKAALVEGEEVGPEGVAELAKLPGRKELLATFIGTLNAVTQKFVSTLNEIPRSFVGTLQAVADKGK